MDRRTEAAAESIQRHMLEESILPDLDIVNPNNRSAFVNATILYGLGTRAEAGANPHALLAEIYRQAEIAWVRGDHRSPPS